MLPRIVKCVIITVHAVQLDKTSGVEKISIPRPKGAPQVHLSCVRVCADKGTHTETEEAECCEPLGEVVWFLVGTTVWFF